MLELDQAIRERHSTRMFLPQPVPRMLVGRTWCSSDSDPRGNTEHRWVGRIAHYCKNLEITMNAQGH